MRSLWAVIRTELLLAWRRPTFWVVQVLWLLPLALTLVTNLGNAMTLVAGAFVAEQLLIALMTWLVLLPLIVGPALTRDLGEVGDLLWATPLDALTHLLGMSAGLLLALLPAFLVHLTAQWLAGTLLLGAPAMLFWRYGPPLLVASTIAALGAAIFLALLLRRTLLLLLVWIALWAALLQGGTGFFGLIESVALASPANLFFQRLQISPSLGLGPSRALVQGLALWFAGLGVLAALLALGAAVWSDVRRAVRPGPALVTWAVVAGLLVGGGWLLHARAVRAQAVPRSPANIQPGAWEVEAHTLEVTVDAERRTLAGSSLLRLAPLRAIDESEVVLRLNPGMRLTAAHTDDGRPLDWRREGDSVIVTLPAPPEQPVALRLEWQGTPSVAYNDYGGHPYSQYPAFDTPQPVRALLVEGSGYLFRDGDWYPWPWGDGPRPHQAGENHVTVRVSGAEALAPSPLHDGVVVWEGELPAVFLVLPPQGSKSVDGRTLHFGPLGGQENVLVTRLEQIARLVPRVAEALGADSAPTHIVALPYLNELVWSGDLLLVPEGTGPLPDDLRQFLLSPRSANELQAPIEDRAVMMLLARAWLAGRTELPAVWVRVSPDEAGIVAVAGIPGEVSGPAEDTDGRWVRAPGSPRDLLLSSTSTGGTHLSGQGQDLRTMTITHLEPADELNLLALWLAVEMADPDVREGDLAVLLAPPLPGMGTDRFEPFLLRLLPLDFPVGQTLKAELFEALHGWLEEVGRARGLRIVGEVMQEQEGPFDLDQLLAELSRRSGVTVEYERSE